jgi:hypothetical protein
MQTPRDCTCCWVKIISVQNVNAPYHGWLHDRFPGHFAQISVNTLLRLKSSIKDVHRMIDSRVSEEVETICSKLPTPPQGITDWDFIHGYDNPDGGDPIPGLLETNDVLKEYISIYPKHWEMVLLALGIVRQQSVHACATLVCPDPIQDRFPTTTIGSCPNPVTQYTGPICEDLGGIKYDFLGVNSLNDIQKCIKLIQQLYNYSPKPEFIDNKKVPGMRIVPHNVNGQQVLYDVWELPEDQMVFDSIARGDTDTVFQFGTPGAKQWLHEFYRNDISYFNSIVDIATFTALDRPGPLNANVTDGTNTRNMLQEFAARKRGEDPIGVNDILMKMLPETKGVIVTQEQVQKIFQEIGQTTPEQADNFRIHVGKKKLAEITKDRELFMPGAIKILGSEDAASQLWLQLCTFGSYGFNFSHAICYSIIGYTCAWLKHYYPTQWWCSVLQNANRNEIETKFWSHCGHLVSPPDIQKSQSNFCIEGDKIRAPLSLLNGVGATAQAEISKCLPITSLRDFCQKLYDLRIKNGALVTKEKTNKRTGIVTTTQVIKPARTAINKTVIAKLIIGGALDSLFESDLPDSEKFNIYTKIQSEVTNTKPTPVDVKWVNLSPLQRWQVRKLILPSRADPVIRFLKNKNIVEKDTGWVWCNSYSDQEEIPIVNGSMANYLIATAEDRCRFAVVGWVLDAETFWGGKAHRITLDVDGQRLELVRWQNKDERDDGVLPHLPVDIIKSVVIAVIGKWSSGKSFSILNLTRMAEPVILSGGDENNE